jgi:predicted glycoside hydrolase/deacetylase ChbG (UPF0249 family)
MMPAYGATVRSVVFHADDFGMNAAVNHGIVTAFRDGLLTSTSLLANAPAAAEACRVWPEVIGALMSGGLRSSEWRRQLAEPSLPFDLGIHLNLTQGRPLSGERYPAQLLDPHGNFPGIGKVFSRLARATNAQLKAVEAELHEQTAWMCDHGHRPTHLNGHQYVEIIPQISIMIPGILERFQIATVRVALERGLVRNVLVSGNVAGYGLALVKRYYACRFRRRMRHIGIQFPDRFFGTSHAGRIDRSLMLRFLGQAKQARLTEIGVHPAVSPASERAPAGDPWFDPLAALRPRELAWLCSTGLPDDLSERGFHLGRLRHNQ